MQLSGEMEALIRSYQNEWQTLHPIERASRLHTEFVKIHPFVDGNGRTARLLMNFELIRDGYPPIVIEIKERLEYYDALDKAHVDGSYDDIFRLVTNCLEKSFSLYFRILGIGP